MALAGELVGVGGHFLFLGLALVSKDWRFLQRMITAPCILFLFYGSVSPFTCCLGHSQLPLHLSSSPETPSSPLPFVQACPAPVPQRGAVSYPCVRRQEASLCTPHPCPQLAWSVSGVCTVVDSEATD